MNKLAQVFEDVLKKSKTNLQSIKLDFYSSSNYVGLFLEESGADYLRKLALDFATAAATAAGEHILNLICLQKRVVSKLALMM